MSNPHEWHVAQDIDGFLIEDEYGDDVEPNRRWTSFASATEHLNKIVPDALADYNEAAYDRHQEYLMETGGGPSLIEQQQATYKIKHGLR